MRAKQIDGKEKAGGCSGLVSAICSGDMSYFDELYNIEAENLLRRSGMSFLWLCPGYFLRARMWWIGGDTAVSIATEAGVPSLFPFR